MSHTEFDVDGRLYQEVVPLSQKLKDTCLKGTPDTTWENHMNIYHIHHVPSNGTFHTIFIQMHNSHDGICACYGPTVH